jgi:glycosyl transferase family 25
MPLSDPIIADTIFLYINMADSQDRRHHMEEQLASLVHERVEAVNGYELFATISEQDKKRFLKAHGRDLRPGELGCYLSHLKAMQRLLDSDYKYAVILEDDASMLETIPDLASYFSDKKAASWDFLRLQSRRQFHKLALSDGFCLNLTRSTGATAYAVNRKAAKILLEKLQVIEAPFDHAFDRPQHFGLRYVHADPLPITVHGFCSTIETSRPQKLCGLAKLPSLWWRTKSEIFRFLWSLKFYLAWKSR